MMSVVSSEESRRASYGEEEGMDQGRNGDNGYGCSMCLCMKEQKMIESCHN